MELDSLLVLAQWSLIGFFVLVHFLLGFKRGTRKTLYYTIVSLILTVVLLVAVSFITVRSVFTPGSLLEFVERFTVIPDNIRIYLVEPELSAVLFAFIDIILRIVFFFVLYPIIKWLLTVLIFRPIYNSMFKSRQEFKLALNNNKGNQEVTFVEKKPKINIVSRILGGSIGMIRGVVVALVLLLPVILLGGITRDFNMGDENNTNTNFFSKNSPEHLENVELNNGMFQDSSISGMASEVIIALQKMDKEGLGQFTDNIKIGGKALDEALFDFVFSTDIKYKDEDGNKTSHKLEIREELKVIIETASLVSEAGFLDDNFDFKKVNYEEHYEYIDQILAQLGRSDLINLALPIGIDVSSRTILPDLLGFDPRLETDEDGNPLHTKEALEYLKTIRLADELNTLSSVIENILLIGSVEELLEIANDPKLFLQLDNIEQRRVADTIKSLSNLELLGASNIAVEYLIRQESLLESFSWINGDDRVAYLQDQLSFLLDNPAFLIGEDGDLVNIGNLVEALFSDDFSDVDYTKFLENISADTFLDEELAPVVSALLTNIINVETVMNAIPFGIDYFIYSTDPEMIRTVADELVDGLNSVNYEDEFLTIETIYRKVVTLGLNKFFEEEADVLVIVDDLLADATNRTAVRDIFKNLFEKSQVVNEVLEIAAEPILIHMLDDGIVKDLALKLVASDIDYGKEASSLLDIVEGIYEFTNIQTVLQALDSGEINDYLYLAADFGSLDQASYNKFRNALAGLQAIDIVGLDLLEILTEDNDEVQLVVPSDALLSNDLKTFLDLAYAVAKPLHLEVEQGTDPLDVSLISLINANELSQALEFNNSNNQSILLATLVDSLKTIEIDFGDFGSYDVPEVLIGAEYDSPLWMNELNTVFSELFTIIELLDDTEFPLSYNNLIGELDPMKLPVSLLSNLTNQGTFNNLMSSYLIRENITNLIDTGLFMVEDSELLITNLELRKDAYDANNLIKGEEVADLLYVALNAVTALEGNTFGELMDGLSLETGIDAFNTIDIAVLETLGMNKIVNGLFREALVNESVHFLVYDLLYNLDLPEELSPINNIGNGIFDFRIALENGAIKEDNLTEILLALRNIEVTNDLIANLNQEAITDFLKDRDIKVITDLLGVEVIHELLDNSIKHPELKKVGANYFSLVEDILSENNLDIRLRYNTYYEVINVPVDNNGLFALAEIEHLFNTYLAVTETLDLDNVDLDSVLTAIKDLENYKRNGLNGYETLVKSELVRGLLGIALQDEVLMTDVADYVNNAVLIDGLSLGLTSSDLLLDATLFDTNKALKEEHFLDLILALAAQDLSIITSEDFTLQYIKDLSRRAFLTSSMSRLEQFYNSQVIESILSNVIESEGVQRLIVTLINEQIVPVEDQLGISIRNITKYDLDLSYELINLNGMQKVLDAIRKLQLNSFDDLNIESIADLNTMLRVEDSDEFIHSILDIPFVFHLVEIALTTDITASVLDQLVNQNLPEDYDINLTSFRFSEELVNEQDVADLAMAILGSHIITSDNLGNPELFTELLRNTKINGVLQPAINHILDARLIHHTIDAFIRLDGVLEFVENEVNKILVSQDIDANIDFSTENEFIPEQALDADGKILKDEFIGLVVMAKTLFDATEITDYTQLNNIANMDYNIIANNLDQIENGFNNLTYSIILRSVIGTVLNDQDVLDGIAEAANDNLIINGNQLNLRGSDFRLRPYLFDNAVLKQEHLTDLLMAIAAQDLNLIKTRSFNFDTIRDLNKVGLSSSELTRLEQLYNSAIFEDILKLVIENESMHKLIASIANDQIANASAQMNLSIRDIRPSDLNLSYNLVNLEAMQKLVYALEQMDITEFSELNTMKVSTVQSLVKVSLTDEIVYSVFDIPLVFHITEILLTTDITGDVLTQLISNNLPERLAVDLTDFRFDPELVNKTEVTNLAMAILGSPVLTGGNITNPQLFNDLIANTIIGGVNKRSIDHILDAKLVHHTIDALVTHEDILNTVVAELNNLLANQNISYRLDMNGRGLIPEVALDEDGKLMKSELSGLVTTVATLISAAEITSYNDFSNINNIDFNKAVKNLDQMEDGFNNLTHSLILRKVLGKALQSEALLDEVANQINLRLANNNISVTLNGSNLLLDAKFFEDGLIIQQHLTDLITAIAAQDLNLVKTRQFNLRTIKDLNNVGLESSNLSRLAQLYNSEIFTYLLEESTNNETLHELVADLANNQIANISANYNINIRPITKDDLNLSYELFNLSAMEKALVAIDNIDVVEFSEFNTLTMSQIKNMLDVYSTDELVRSIFEVPLVFHIVEIILTTDITADVINQVISTRAPERFQVDVSDFAFNEDLVTIDEVTALAMTFLGLDITQAMLTSPQLFNELNRQISIGGASKLTIDHILDTKLIHHTLDMIIKLDGVGTLVERELNNLLANQNISYQFELAGRKLVPAQANDSEGLIAKSELKALLNTASIIVNTTKINSYNELRNITNMDLNSIVAEIDNMDNGFNNLTESIILRAILGKALQSESLLNEVANQINLRLANNNISVTLTGDILTLDERFFDNGLLIQQHLTDLITSVAAQDLNLIKSRKIDLVNILALNTVGLESSNLTRLEQVYNSEIIEVVLKGITDNETLHQFVADLINEQIFKYSNNLNVNIPEITGTQLGLSYELFNLSAMEQVIVALELLDVGSISELMLLRNAYDISQAFRIAHTDDAVSAFIDIPIVYHILDMALTNNVVPEVLHTLAINRLPSGTEFNKDLFVFEEGLINEASLTEFIMSVLGSGLLESKNLTNPNLFTDLLELRFVAGVEKPGIDHLIGSEILHVTLDKVLQDNDLHNSFITQINKLLTSNNTNYQLGEINRQVIPAIALDENGRIKQSEFSQIVRSVAALNLESYGQLTSINGITSAINLMTRESLDELLNSEIIYYFTGYVPFTNRVASAVASVINNRFNKTYFNAADFSFEQYNVLETEGTYAGYMTKDEFAKLLDALQNTDIEAIAFNGNTFDIIDSALTVLLEEDTLDYYFESNLLTGLLDKLVNADDTVFELFYLDIINSRVGSRLDLNLTVDDNLFAYHANAYDANGQISPEEVRLVLIGLETLGLSQSSIDLEMLLSTVDRNIDEEGLDDFDRLFGSFIIKSLLSNILLNDKTMDATSTLLNNRQSRITLTSDDLRIPEDATTEGLVKASEFKSIIRTINMLDLGGLDFGHLNIESLTILLDRNIDKDGKDDFDRMLDSIIIHNMISNILQSDSFSEFAGDAISGIFNNDIKSYDMAPDVSLLDENDRFGKSHIKDSLRSVSLLGVTEFSEMNELDISTIMDLIGRNEVESEDDLFRFLNSKYITHTLSNLLVSDTIKGKLATGGKFASNDLSFGGAYHGHNYLSEMDVYKLFVSMNALGINSFDNIEVNNQTLKALNDSELDIVLDSSYMFEVIDLTLKAQIENIPANAKEDNGQIRKVEVKGLIKALDILDIEDPSAIGTDFTIAQLDELLILDSAIINQLMSDQILENEIIDVPDASIQDGVIKTDELNHLVQALMIITGGSDTVISEIDMTSLNVTTLTLTLLLAINENNGGSPIITRLISEKVIDALGTDIHKDVLINDNKDILRRELILLTRALDILGQTELDESIDASNVTIGQLDLLVNLDSFIINKLMTNEMIKNENIYTDESIENEMITKNEFANLINALLVINNDEADTVINDIDFDDLVITTAMLNALLAIDDLSGGSRIVTRLISDNVIEALEPANVHEQAYVDVTTKEEIKRSELILLANALDILKQTNITSDLNIQSVTLVELGEVNALGSLILQVQFTKAFESTSLILTGENVRDEFGNIRQLEVANLIDNILVLNDDPALNANITNISSLAAFIDSIDNSDQALLVANAVSNIEPENYSEILKDTLEVKLAPYLP